MHQMSLSKADTAVNKKRVVDLGGGLGHSQGCCMSHFIVGSHNKGIKGVFRIQVCTLHNAEKGGIRCFLNRGCLWIQILGLIFRVEIDRTLETRHFLNGNAEDEGIFLLNEIQSDVFNVGVCYDNIYDMIVLVDRFHLKGF